MNSLQLLQIQVPGKTGTYCEECGKKFIPYRNRDSKFCRGSCYHENRRKLHQLKK